MQPSDPPKPARRRPKAPHERHPQFAHYHVWKPGEAWLAGLLLIAFFCLVIYLITVLPPGGILSYF